MIICVAGDNPNYLGGHADHAPFRLFVKARFAQLLKQYPDATLCLSLQLGPGTWCAEVAVEHGRHFVSGIVPSYKERWTEPLIRRYEALYIAGGSAHWDSETSPIPLPDAGHYPSSESVYLLACWDGKRVSSPAARAIRLLQPFGEQATVEQLTVDNMPPAYQMLGHMERLREIFPSNFLPRITSVLSDMELLLKEWPENAPGKVRAQARAQEVLMLARIIATLEERR